ncbi:rhomboid family intramembrane serine protease [Uliginosibacterium gangwonense]|uniref:rhomboid family intramembrane serine protease n=1 Tax=Uliginosibacterium gangwonense TaxID=392736 RepID=UPI00035D0DF8|nr:rhomboid family intramembrane serine protease [Uliginosibacterium gangwonense]
MPKLSFRLSIGKVTLLLLIANIAVYAIQVYGGVDWKEPTVGDLLSHGGNAAPFTLMGQPWRLASSMFVHGGIVHLAMNMYMLFICGTFAERVFGSIRFATVYLVAGLFGSFASAWWNANRVESATNAVANFPALPMGLPIGPQLELVVSVGASGALLGMAGACLARHFLRTARGGEGADNGMAGALTQTVALTLVMGFAGRGIDNACHVGGLIAGMIAGAVLSMSWVDGSVARRVLASALVVFASLGMLYPLVNQPASAALQELHDQVQTELNDQAKEQAQALEKKQLAAMIEADRKNAPTPVDEKTARGLVIPLGETVSSMVLGKDGKHLYMSLGEANALWIVDLTTQQLVDKIAGPAFAGKKPACGNVCRGRGAKGVALSPDERFAYVSSMVEDGVAIIDLSTKKLVGQIHTGSYPGPLRVSADGRRAYVLNIVDNSVSALDLQTRQALGKPFELSGGSAANLPFGHPVSLWLANADSQILVYDNPKDVLDVLDASSLKLLKSIPLTEGNVFFGAISSSQKKPLWIMGSLGLEGVDLDKGTVTQGLPACGERLDSFAIDSSPDNTFVMVADQRRSTLRRVKLATMQTVGVFPLQGWPGPVLFAPDGHHVYAISNGASPEQRSLSILDITKSMDAQAYVQENGELLCTADKQ